MKKIHLLPILMTFLLSTTYMNSQESAILTDKMFDSTSTTDVLPTNNQHILYYSNGSVKEIREFRDGKLNGFWKYFYTDGKLKKEGSFLRDKEHGTWKAYDQKGSLLFIENYKEGIENGIWKSFYPNGKVKLEGAFVNGKRQGTWKIYNDRGVLERIITFENDLEKSTSILNTESIDLNFFSMDQSIGNY